MLNIQVEKMTYSVDEISSFLSHSSAYLLNGPICKTARGPCTKQPWWYKERVTMGLTLSSWFDTPWIYILC